MDFKDWLAIADLVLKTFISGGLAWIGWLAYKINRDKLKLELYNRRVTIYTSAVEYHIALTYEKDADFHRECLFNLIKHVMEVVYLFGKNSDVSRIAVELSQAFTDKNRTRQTELIKELTEAMTPWLDFQNYFKPPMPKLKNLSKHTPEATLPSSQS